MVTKEVLLWQNADRQVMEWFESVKTDDGKAESLLDIKITESQPIYKYVLAKTQAELVQKLHNKIEMYRDANLSEDCNMTLSEWLDRWFYEYVTITIRPNTLNGYEMMVKNQIKPYLGNRLLSTLTTAVKIDR